MRGGGGGERERGLEKKKGGASVCVFVCVCERGRDAVRHTVIQTEKYTFIDLILKRLMVSDEMDHPGSS